ncbi:hypothetical protein BDY19DRAFT_1052113 [Irpex rosettiformis]|uniref:Uncharacterized protein n=1 Tax=Irpex rosettiformis TaxID=378272 RepID=A0ACB8UIS2_9APHY|nr:hypothetical protein BDY19DRAFT_1052113 [Irpex rosettiformis]
MPLPIPVSLSNWAQDHITALFTAKTTKEFDDAFDAFLAHFVDSIVVNGQKLTRDQYKASLVNIRAPEFSAEVKYLGVVEAKDEKQGEKAGEVGLFARVGITEKLIVLGQRATETVTISFNLKIIQDTHQPVKSFDPRRVSSLTSVLVKAQNPIVAPHHSHPLIPPTEGK